MGYILPIHLSDYTDYHKRMISKKRTISEVKSANKVILQTPYEEIRHEVRTQKQIRNSLQENEEYINPLDNTDRLFTEVTGLGQYINEQI